MKTLGIIGGLGPMATVCLLELLVRMTEARRDQDHLNAVVYHQPSIPDRTAYILGKSRDNPLPALLSLAEKLNGQELGCVIMPCNTAHYFYDDLSAALKAPLLHIIRETAAYLKKAGIKTAGIMATEGTIACGLYQKELSALDIRWTLPQEGNQKLVMELIYDQVKAGRAVEMTKFHQVTAQLFQQGADCVILGCTELSVIKKTEDVGPRCLDALEVLAYRALETCGFPIKESYADLITK